MLHGNISRWQMLCWISVTKMNAMILMEEIGLTHKPKRKPNGIAKADKEARKSDDLIKRNFTAEKPLEKCVTDMTEIKASDIPFPRSEKSLYLSLIISAPVQILVLILFCIFFVNFLFVTSSKAAVAALTITNSEIPTLDSEWMSINECICYFLPGNLVNSLNSCSCNLHRCCTLLLTITILVQKTNCLVLIYRQNNGCFFLSIICRKKL